MHVLSWPKTRRATATDGFGWLVTIEPGRLVLTRTADGTRIEFADTDELRSLAMQVYAAALDHDGATQQAAVKASLARRAARVAAGQAPGLRHRPFVEPPEPPIHMEVPA